jgi:hypothetical protein
MVDPSVAAGEALAYCCLKNTFLAWTVPAVLLLCLLCQPFCVALPTGAAARYLYAVKQILTADGSAVLELQAAMDWLEALSMLASDFEAVAVLADMQGWLLQLTEGQIPYVSQGIMQLQYNRQTLYETRLCQCQQEYRELLATQGTAAAKAVLLPTARAVAKAAQEAAAAASAAAGGSGMAAAHAAPGAASAAGGAAAAGRGQSRGAAGSSRARGSRAGAIQRQQGEDQQVSLEDDGNEQHEDWELPEEERVNEVDELPVFVPASKRKKPQQPRAKKKPAAAAAAPVAADLLADVEVRSTCKPRGVHAASAAAAAAALGGGGAAAAAATAPSAEPPAPAAKKVIPKGVCHSLVDGVECGHRRKHAGEVRADGHPDVWCWGVCW